MTFWVVPDWALSLLSLLLMGVIVLALVVGLSVIAFLLLWIANGMLAWWLNCVQNTKLLLFATWWKLRGSKTPQAMFDAALDERLQYHPFRVRLRERLREAEEDHG